MTSPPDCQLPAPDCKPAPRPRLFLIADLHLKAARHQNEELAWRLDQLASEFDRDRGDWLAVLGDTTDNGLVDEYAEAERLLARFSQRILLVEGNHDNGPFGVLCFQGARARWRTLAKRLGSPREVAVGKRLLRAGDTVKRSWWIQDTARGLFGGAELRATEAFIERARAANLRPTLLGHHSLYEQDRTLLLEDASAARLIIEGRCDYFCGHTHFAARRDVAGYVVQCFADLRHTLAARIGC